MSYKCFFDIHPLRENANKINRCRLLPEDQVVYDSSLRSPPTSKFSSPVSSLTLQQKACCSPSPFLMDKTDLPLLPSSIPIVIDSSQLLNLAGTYWEPTDHHDQESR